MRAVGATRFWMDGPAAIEPLRLRRMPMLAAALAFAAGDILARRWHGPLLLATATLTLFLLTLLALRKAPRVAMLPVLALWVSLGCWCAQIQPPVSAQAALTPYADGLSRTVRGRIVRVRALTSSTLNEDEPQTSFSDPAAWEVETAPALQSIDLDV